MNVAVVGLGKIGLPLAVQFALQGATVTGVDINPTTVELVNEGNEPVPGESGLQTALERVVESGHLRATTDTTTAVGASDVVVVVAPLFVDSQGVPDFASMDAATRATGRGLKAGTLVSYETTLPIGTTRQRFAPLLEAESGLTAGRDFHLAFSPERVLTGRVFADLKRYPKIVGGLTPKCGAVAQKFYESVLEFDSRADLNRPNGVWDLGSCEASEMAKLAETTYRDVNIGLANQFARYAASVGVDVFKVIEACNSQPYSHIHQPGIAVGGHCIPIYPQMYLWNDPDATIVRAAREASWAMPSHSVDQLERHHGSLKGQKVVVLGASYRGAVKETAFSGVFPVVDVLKSRGASVMVHDPMYSAAELTDLGFAPFTLGNQSDAAIIQADHPEYAQLTAIQLPGVRTVMNGRRMSLRGLPSSVTVVCVDGSVSTGSASDT
jgi:nucleotide sugar dehydrogenase